MKKILAASFLLLFTFCSNVHSGIIYNDSTSDLGATFSTFSHLNIKSVEVSNTATDISFKIEVDTASITSPDWGKYMVAIDSAAGGTSSGNGWGRPINMSGMDYWFGGWVDSGTPSNQLWNYGGVTWNLIDTNANTISGATVTYTRSLASLGLSIGSTFTFDVFSSGGGGGDSAVDALSTSTPSITNWSDTFNSASSLTYTVVPEPTALLMVGLVGLAGMVRRKR